MTSLPTISIVTPSYNQGQFLEQTIQSVLNQNYPDLEYIIIDGGSSDNSAQIIKKYEEHLKYWQSQRDGGQTDAINIGLEHCTGDILGWINSDDIYVPGAFERVAAAFEDPSVQVVHGGRILINEFGDTVGWSPTRAFRPHQYGFTVCSETTFWRAETGAKAGQLNADLKFAMDLEFFSRLYKVGKFKALPAYLGCFRGYADSKSATMQNVGDVEAKREWEKLFGNENWKVAPPMTRKRMLIDALANPTKILLPYLRYKIKPRTRL